MTTMQILLSLATYFGWNLQQLDVKNAFLYGDLEEEVFMELHQGFNKGMKERSAGSRRPYMGSSNPLRLDSGIFLML